MKMMTFVQFVYAGGEWEGLAPFGDSPTDLMKHGKVDAACIVMFAGVDDLQPAIEKLAAQLMEEIHLMQQDGRNLLGDQAELDDDNGGHDAES